MPAVAKTSDAGVISAARRLTEAVGASAVSLQDIAAAVGVRAPSLHKRFASRAVLLAAVERDVLADLQARLQEAAAGAPSFGDSLRAMAAAYRAFAHANPRAYALMFADDAPHGPEATQARADAAAPLLMALRATLGEADALPAARVITAFMHGFVSMELAGAFRLGGDVEAAFERGLDLVLPLTAETPQGHGFHLGPRSPCPENSSRSR